MDLSTTTPTGRHLAPKAIADPALKEIDGPTANGDPMATPEEGERVIWTGRPDTAVLARTAFHTRKVAIYFAGLIIIAMLLGDMRAAIACALLAVAAHAILSILAWRSARSTLYILTETRLMMRIGMAIETRINIPLKHIRAANLKLRRSGHGDIALKLGGDRMLGYLLLWPHARPFKLGRPEPMLRAVPDVQELAKLLAERCEAAAPMTSTASPPAARSEQAALPARRPAPAAAEFEGAPA